MPDTVTPPPLPPKKNFLAQLREALLADGPWPVVVLVLAGLFVFLAIVLWAPADARPLLFGAHGLVFTLLGWLMSSPLEK